MTRQDIPATIRLMNLDGRLIRQALKETRALFLAIAAGFLAGIATALQARQVSQIIARVFLDGQALAQVMPLMELLLGVIVARAALSFISEGSANSVALRIKQQLRDALAQKLVDLGPAYAQGERSGELINAATVGIENLDAYFSQYLPQIALASLLPLAYLALVLPRDPLSALVLLLTGPLIPFFMFLIGSQAQALTRRQFTALGRMSAYFLDTLQGIATLKALGRSREQRDRVAQVSEQYRVTTMSVLRITFLSALVLELLSTIGTAIIAVEIGLRLLYARMGLEEAFFILLLAPEFYLPLRSLGLRFHAAMTGVSAARRIFEIMEQPAPLAAKPAAPVPTVDWPAVDLHQAFTIEFCNVHYAYPGRDLPALEDVSFKIMAGQTTALVGPSGAGKSTIASLLLGFMRPLQGSLRWNGQDLAEIPLDAWHSQIAWVPQSPYLFHGTVAENLRIARPGASLAELGVAAEQAHLSDWIEALPERYESQIGESGARLSGGQAQRLALARAFLRDAPLLVMDEPTAHLDVEQEHMLQESTRRLCAGRTVLVIAHRLPTVARADRIIALDGGRILEEGTHAELLRNGGLYAALFAAYGGRGA